MTPNTQAGPAEVGAGGGASLYDLHGAFGRHDAGRFHDDDYERTSVEKQEQRQRIADFILGHFDECRWLYLLSMPGRHWIFENLIRSCHPRTQFVGIERSATTFARSAPAMVSSVNNALAIRSVDFAGGSFEYARTPAFPQMPGRGTARSHRLLLMQSDVYATALAGDFKATRKQRTKFNNKFYSRNAAWLDFTSGFCSQFERTVSNLHRCMSHADAPVALTFMYGRDIAGQELGRVTRICELQPRFLPSDYWLYRGKGRTSMMTVCGMLRGVSP